LPTDPKGVHMTVIVASAPARKELKKSAPLLTLVLLELIGNGAFWLTGWWETVGADALKLVFFVGWSAALVGVVWSAVALSRRSSRTTSALCSGIFFVLLVLAYGSVFATVLWAGSNP
jgi:hypothetical protein